MSRGEISGFEADAAFKSLRSNYDAWQTAQIVARSGVHSFAAAPTNYTAALSNYTAQLTGGYSTIQAPFSTGPASLMGGNSVNMPVYVYTNDPQVVANTLTTNLWNNGIKTK